MSDLAERFEVQRPHLRRVAYRMLGSLSEADDAVQEAWFRLSRTGDVENLPGWLTTVVSRICLDMLRSRKARREEIVDSVPDRATDGDGPEDEALLVESVGRALLVVLDLLSPAERVALVLHDTFAVPFDQIAVVLERTPAAAKKLASRARQRVRGTPAVPEPELARQRHIVDAFLAAAREGDFAALLEVLAPDVVRTADAAALRPGMAARAQGAEAVAEQTVGFARRSRYAEVALVDGAVGVIVAPRGRLLFVLTVTVADDRIASYDVVADPARLAGLDLAVLGEEARA
ncbi:sigma-70 family RNA polymerase sigma factor [Amycolatopsis sp. K13G38]|uniref:Sigma-70 family RNA polymerase sigma factor n=1 Tax=Amycolatopsis acididurans TaxID=2724524 RepID=A0ABX1IZL5_9PSEU|nr:sigma-70 family RNA polymerase sigma factor [Amycolatopsis acididurans]NKQ52962.1 sigma-70 family RNA polymerase sigma factor [Amycolatopsis acididurans]